MDGGGGVVGGGEGRVEVVRSSHSLIVNETILPSEAQCQSLESETISNRIKKLKLVPS